MKMKALKYFDSKTIVLVLALILVFSSMIGTTYAWLAKQTDPVVNTFTYGDINIGLEETDTELDNDDDPTTNDYEMIPGNELVKDPKVIVKAESEESWLFVKLEKNGGNIILDGVTYDFDDFIEYTIITDNPATEAIEGWTQLTDADGKAVEGVFYREAPATITEAGVVGKDTEYGVITGDKVKVKDTVSKEMLNALDDPDAEETTYPTLTITAYAVQKDNIKTAIEAWELIEAPEEELTPTPEA